MHRVVGWPGRRGDPGFDLEVAAWGYHPRAGEQSTVTGAGNGEDPHPVLVLDEETACSVRTPVRADTCGSDGTSCRELPGATGSSSSAVAARPPGTAFTTAPAASWGWSRPPSGWAPPRCATCWVACCTSTGPSPLRSWTTAPRTPAAPPAPGWRSTPVSPCCTPLHTRPGSTRSSPPSGSWPARSCATAASPALPTATLTSKPGWLIETVSGARFASPGNSVKDHELAHRTTGRAGRVGRRSRAAAVEVVQDSRAGRGGARDARSQVPPLRRWLCRSAHMTSRTPVRRMSPEEVPT